MDLTEQIKSDIESNSIMLYMKGTKEMPMCGFSNTVVQILNHYDVAYKDVPLFCINGIGLFDFQCQCFFASC